MTCDHSYECDYEIDQDATITRADWYERCPMCGEKVSE